MTDCGGRRHPRRRRGNSKSRSTSPRVVYNDETRRVGATRENGARASQRASAAMSNRRTKVKCGLAGTSGWRSPPPSQSKRRRIRVEGRTAADDKPADGAHVLPVVIIIVFRAVFVSTVSSRRQTTREFSVRLSTSSSWTRTTVDRVFRCRARALTRPPRAVVVIDDVRTKRPRGEAGWAPRVRPPSILGSALE